MAHYLKEHFQNEAVPTLMKDFNFNNVMQVPKLQKIVVNVGVGEALDNAKALDATVDDISTITGQRPIITKAKKSIATYKLREGRSIGVKVTLRGEKMWAFLDRLVLQSCLHRAVSRRQHFSLSSLVPGVHILQW